MRPPRWFNRSRVLSKARVITALILILSAAAIAFLAVSPHAAAQAPTAPTTQAAAARQLSPEESRKRQDWRESMVRKPAPKKGCFNAAYPNTEWQEVQCVAAPNIPAGPRHGPRPAVVGNNNDISAQAPSGHITQAIGNFENVMNVTSETGRIGNAGPSIADTYTLQINSDFFTGSTACSGSPNPNCLGWEQWIYWNTPGSGGFAAMQYWLINYNTNCPAGQNWNQIALFGGTSCWKNSANSVSVPNQPITNIANWKLTGTSTATGDSITMSTGANVYTATGDNAVAASTAWTIAEFNIFGYGGDNSGNGDTAVFNAGASVNTRTEIIYGGNSPPNCVAQGFTAEMNNLSFGPTAPAATAPGPAVIFQESIAGGAMSACSAATSIGDTHLTTVKGLLYDFQASGDFVLAEVDPDFVVQARQVSGAPNWPNATVNKAVATRMGRTKVAICLPSAGNDIPAKLQVDGKATEIGDGNTISTPDGVDISRKGNVYTITSQSGNSVRATTHPSWIDVTLGLGCWPAKVRGLIANPKDNANQIQARDGTVLTNAFPFEDLYHHYADSWRVPRDESLLADCGQESERGIPERPFYAKDLEPNVREKALAVCTAAGVKPGPLLDACTLDVAVIGNDEAAKVFVEANPPVVVGSVVAGTHGTSGLDCRLCWLLVGALVVIILILWMLLLRKRRMTA